MTEINVAFNCSNEYVYVTGVAIASILLNSKSNDSFNIVILHEDIPLYKQKIVQSLSGIKNCNINFKKIPEGLFNDYKNFNLGYRYSNFRLKLATLLPEFDKVIFLDSDVLIMSSLEELWNLNLEKYHIAAVQNPDYKFQYNYTINDAQKFPTKRYNTGVMVVNLSKWRNDDSETTIRDAFIWYTSKYSNWSDQQALNIAFKDSILELDANYNLGILAYVNNLYDDITVFENAIRNVKILHYYGAFERPWLCPSVYGGAEWWAIARKTPFYEALLVYAGDKKSLQGVQDICNLLPYIIKKDKIIKSYRLFKLLKLIFPIHFVIKKYNDYKFKYKIIKNIKNNINHCHNFKIMY